ncbi:MAG: ABC transporter ATP-binding protein [Lentisphaeria bacterium]|nr:ABC transporter ATP-binding protein [Lentisphaeria bacterium]
MSVTIRNLSFFRGNTPVLQEINADFADNSVTAIIGGNGSGKSTLLKVMAGILKYSAGSLLLDSREVASFPVKVLARKRAILLQNPAAPPELSVNELLKLARFAFDTGKKYDQDVIDKALADTGCTALAGRRIGTLSGGEFRKVFLAMALAQEPELLLLDVVEAGLDADFCRKLPALLRKLIVERHLTVVMVMHDLDLALHCATDILGIADGKIRLAVKNSADAADQLKAFTSGAMHISTGPDGHLNARLNYF